MQSLKKDRLKNKYKSAVKVQINTKEFILKEKKRKHLAKRRCLMWNFSKGFIIMNAQAKNKKVHGLNIAMYIVTKKNNSPTIYNTYILYEIRTPSVFLFHRTPSRVIF